MTKLQNDDIISLFVSKSYFRGKKEVFESLTVIIPASNETDLLKNTITGVLQSEVYDDISQIILFLKSENCPSAETAKQFIEESNCNKIEIKIQKSVTYDAAFTEIPSLVKGSHFVVMVSDGEVDPRTLKDFVCIAKQKPKSIRCGSKWHKDSVVKNASVIRAVGSKIINNFAALIFGVKAKDIFSIFQIYPLEIYKRLNTNIYEYTLKPLRMGIEYIEIPTFYKRAEGRKSNFSFWGLSKLALRYIISIFRVRFLPKSKL